MTETRLQNGSKEVSKGFTLPRYLLGEGRYR